jgi:proline iminopeptidase
MIPSNNMQKKCCRLLLLVVCLLCDSSTKLLVRAFSAQPKPTSTTKLRTLYPPLAPYNNGTLAVDSLHTLAYAEFGAPHGIPALFLHGGPGAGCFARHAQFFDPLQYRIVLLDQRGSGASTPRGEIRNNTLGHLIRDCETLREQLGVDQWGVLLGGSWGSTLALAYAQDHPTRIQSLVLRGVCLLRPQEVDWLFGGDGDVAGVATELDCTEAWRTFQAAVGIVGDNDNDDEEEPVRRQTLHAYYDRLLSKDSAVQLAAAGAWMRWESNVSAVAAKQRESSNDDAHVVLVGRSSEAGTRVWVLSQRKRRTRRAPRRTAAVASSVQGAPPQKLNGTVIISRKQEAIRNETDSTRPSCQLGGG